MLVICFARLGRLCVHIGAISTKFVVKSRNFGLELKNRMEQKQSEQRCGKGY